MTPVISLENLTKHFGSETALDAVTLEVRPGTVFALLGENGAGKTTSIRIMLGLAEPDAGRAEVLGLPSDSRGLEIRRRVGYVPERATLYEWMTVEEIGWFTAGFHADGFLTEYARLLQHFKLDPLKKIKTLSKGMRAKVCLSLALANRPELLILDEPTSGLDAMVRHEFLDSMVDRAAEGKTVFLSSHQIGEVERVADVVAILRRGKLLLVEPLDELKNRVRRITITMAGDAAPPSAGGVVLSERTKPRQWQALVRDADERRLAEIAADESVEKLEVGAASLEDIFVAYMQSGVSHVQTANADGKVLQEV